MSSLRANFISGALYTGIAKYVGIAVSIIITAILARLIAPEDFGIIAIATVFINFFSTLTTVGISPAVVQNKTITNDELKSINTLTFAVATVITALYLCAIPLIIKAYDGNEAFRNIMLLLGVNVFFSIATTIPNAMILKNKLFKFIAIRTITIQVVLGIASVIAAFYGAGIYALLINPICGSIFIFFVNIHKYPIGFAKIKKNAIDKILSFSIFQMLFNLVYLAYRNIDKLFVGNKFGLTSLGYYEKSYRLMLLPLDNVSSVVSPVLHPLLSEYQNDKGKIWETYLTIIETLSEFCFILSVALYFLADSIIVIMYGDRWLPAVPIFKVLALSIGFQLLQVPVGAVLQSINKVKGLFFSSLFSMLFVCVACAFAAFMDECIYTSVGLDIAFMFGFCIYQFYVSKYFNRAVSIIFSKIIRPMVLSLVFFSVCMLCHITFPIENAWLRLSIYVSLTLIYSFIMLKTGNLAKSLAILTTIIKRKKNSD